MDTLAANQTVPLGRMLFVQKQGYTREQLVIEATGPYTLAEKEDCFVIRNADCCKSIVVTVKAGPDQREISMLQELDDLYRDISCCQKCALALERINPVRDGGNPVKAAVVFVGEAPGANEIKHGIPFAGEAGKKLNHYLAQAGLARSDIYITNVVRCRPTTNGGKRNRTPGREIPLCGEWLNRELEIIRPGTVVTLGNVALKWLCGKEYGIGDCHGRLINAGSFSIYPMYHPAAAIYKRDLEDLIISEFRELGRYLGRVGN